MIRHFLALFAGIVAGLVAWHNNSTVPDDELLEFVRNREGHSRVTTLPFKKDDATSRVCIRPEGFIPNPHDLLAFHIYTNDSGVARLWDPLESFSVGTVIVKEKIIPESGDIELFTGMVKREQGFAAEVGDWQFFTVDREIKQISFADTEACIKCHQRYADSDFVTKLYAGRGHRAKPKLDEVWKENRWQAIDGVIRCGTSTTIFLPASLATIHGRLLTSDEAKKIRAQRSGGQQPQKTMSSGEDHDDLTVFGGPKLRYEPSLEKNTLGYWTQADDWVSWRFEVPQAGFYRVSVLQGCGDGSGGSKVEVAVNGSTLEFVVEETGGFQKFRWLEIGQIEFETTGEFSLTVKPHTKPGPAVMDLRQVRLESMD